MFDIDPQIIRIGKVGRGIILGLIVGGMATDILKPTSFLMYVCFLALGMLAGAGISIIGVFKEKDKEEDEE